MQPEEFIPPRLFGNRHLQTMFASLSPWAVAPPQASPLRIPIPSGGALHAVGHFHSSGVRTAVVVIHGIGGSSESHYVVRAARALYRAGVHVVRLNMRAQGSSLIDAPSLQHAGLIEDPSLTLAHLAADPRVLDVALLGFSLGGNVALQLAASWRAAPPTYVRAVASISAPIDLERASRSFEGLATLPYRLYVVRQLSAQARAFASMHPGKATWDPSLRWRTVRHYDETVVAPMHGFSDALDYYKQSSSGPGLGQISVPTLIAHAEDDPMVPAASVKPWLGAASRSVEVAWSQRGGHVGWIAGPTPTHWQDTWAMRHAIALFGRDRTA